MKDIGHYIIAFFIGFYGFALIVDEPSVILIKSYIFFGAVTVALVLLLIDDYKKKK